MIDSTTTVSDIVRERPGLAPLFEQLKIDYCCGGNRPLDSACAERGLDPATVVSMLNASLGQESDGSGERVDTLPTAALVEHIVTRHHVYLRRELPRIVELTQKVASGHVDQEPRLSEVATLVARLAPELLRHMQTEEDDLFPALLDHEETRSADAAGTDPTLLSFLLADHEEAGAMLARIRELTDDYTPPQWACNTTRAVYHSLGELERDVHEHVHKENNTLFPRLRAEQSDRVNRDSLRMPGPAAGHRTR